MGLVTLCNLNCRFVEEYIHKHSLTQELIKPGVCRAVRGCVQFTNTITRQLFKYYHIPNCGIMSEYSKSPMFVNNALFTPR